MTPPAPSHRVRLTVNRIFPKMRARIAKFLKNRPIPHIVPAQEDQTAKMNARATEKAIHYQWRRLQLEQKYKDALLWAKDSAKAVLVVLLGQQRAGPYHHERRTRPARHG
jgi:hypothetical protein